MKPIGFGRRRLGALALPGLGLPALAACGSSPEPGLYTLAVRQSGGGYDEVVVSYVLAG